MGDMRKWECLKKTKDWLLWSCSCFCREEFGAAGVLCGSGAIYIYIYILISCAHGSASPFRHFGVWKFSFGSNLVVHHGNKDGQVVSMSYDDAGFTGPAGVVLSETAGV